MNEVSPSGAVMAPQAAEPAILFEAAWAALTSGAPRELRHLESLLECPCSNPARLTRADIERISQLQLLLASTARNLRLLRSQLRCEVL